MILDPISSQNSTAKFEKLIHILLICTILVAAFSARSWLAYDQVFSEQAQTKLLGVDAYYHLRQAKYIVKNYPHIQRWDSGSHYPKRIKNRATGLFAFSVASISVLLYSRDASTDDIAAVAAWFPPILHTLSMLFLYFLTVKLLNRRAALVAILLFAIYPGNTLDRSILGFADHHVMEYFLALAIALSLVYLMDDKQVEKPWWQPAFIHALPLVTLAYTWQGAAIYIPVIGLALLLYTTIVSAAGGKIKARAVSRYALALTIMFLTVNYLFPELVVYPRAMYWLLVGSIGLGVAAWAYAMLLGKLTKKRPMFVSCATLVFLLGGALLLLYITPIGQKFIAEVLTSNKLFIREEISVNSALYFNRLGSVAVLALVSILVALVMFYKGLIAAQVIIPLTFAYVWLTVWWLSGDFGYLAPAFLSFAATVTLYGGYQLIKAKKRWIKGCSIIAVFMMLFSPLYPLKLVVKPWVDQSKLASSIIYGDEWFEALKWLKSNTPATIDLDSNLPASNYGVIAAWDFGNIIASHGERIPMASRYPSASLFRWALMQDEQKSLQQICPKCTKQQGVRYAIVDANSFGPFFYAKTQYIDKPAHLTQIGNFDVNGRSIARYSFAKVRDNSMLARLYAQDGMQLSHYRLIYESSALSYNTALLQLLPENKFNFTLLSFPVDSPAKKETYQAWDKADVVITDDGYLYDDFITSTIKIYQVVKGEQLQGVTTPGAKVQARLVLHSLTTNRRFNYQRTTVADEQGHYVITVPYSTNSQPISSTVVATQAYQIFIKKTQSSAYVFEKEFFVADSSK